MKRILFSVLILALLLCGCGRSEEPAPTPTATPNLVTSAPAEESGEAEEALAVLKFSTTDRSGNSWDESCFEGHSLTMINFFEPWCGPCVGELPELQQLSEDFADRGFQLLGVYQTEDGMDEVLSEAGVSYPILHYTEEMYPFTSQYVPTTVFFNEKGECLGQVIGACNYGKWEATILGLYKDMD